MLEYLLRTDDASTPHNHSARISYGRRDAGLSTDRPEAEVVAGKLSMSSKRRLINGCYTKNSHVKDITQS